MSSDNNGTENKVIFLGEAGVGKTTLIKVSIGQKFDKVYNSSISLSFNPKKIIYENKQYTFYVDFFVREWQDTAFFRVTAWKVENEGSEDG